MRDQVVAQQDGRLIALEVIDGRAAATQLRLVEHVVVNERGHVYHLDNGGDPLVESFGPADDVGATITVEEPWDGYAQQPAAAIVARLRGADPATKAVVALYERGHKARATVQQMGTLEVPMHLRNAPTKLMKGLGYGRDYQYAHDVEGKVAHMQSLPDSLRDRTYYHPTSEGVEKRIRERLEEIKRLRQAQSTRTKRESES